MTESTPLRGIYVVGVRASRLLTMGPYDPQDAFGKQRGSNWLISAGYCSDVYHVEAGSVEEAESIGWKRHDDVRTAADVQASA